MATSRPVLDHRVGKVFEASDRSPRETAKDGPGRRRVGRATAAPRACGTPASRQRGGAGVHEGTTVWFTDHGITDADQQHDIRQRSSRVYGVPLTAIDRHWARSVGLARWQEIHGSRVPGT